MKISEKKIYVYDQEGNRLFTGITYNHIITIQEIPYTTPTPSYDPTFLNKENTPLPTPTPSYDPTFFIPVNLELVGLLNKHGKKQRFLFHYLYIVSSIIYLRVTNKKVSKQDFVPLHHETLIKTISERKAAEIIQDLIAWKVIESDWTWRKGIKSTGYRLAPEYLNAGFKKVIVQDKLIIKKMNKWKLKQKEEATKAGGDYLHLYNQLMNIRINYNAALEHINKNYVPFTPDYDARMLQVELINGGDLFFKIDSKGNRAHTNLTNLSSDLRQFILVDGSKLGQVDMKNSQPFLLNLLLKNRVVTQAQMDEYRNFKKITEKGVFYEFLMQHFGVDESERKKFKELFFGRVFFDVNRQELKKEEKLFQQLFPNIFGWIRELKQEDYTQLAIQLQKAESNVIINECIRRIRTEKPNMFVSTIHDSIVSEPQNLPYVQQVMKDVFELKFNLKPGLRQELF